MAVVEVDELDALLDEAGRRGFMWHMFRMNRDGPEVLAGVFRWRGYADVFVLFGDQSAHAYRMPTGASWDVFAPRDVAWWYGNSGPVWTLRALLTLPAPEDPEAPTALTPAPANSGVPGDRIPVRLRRRGS